jgi:hypothetical protein
MQACNGFEFEDNGVVDNKVGDVAANAFAFVVHRINSLALKCDTCMLQFDN